MQRSHIFGFGFSVPKIRVSALSPLVVASEIKRCQRDHEGGRRHNMKQAGMAQAWRRGTLGNLAGHQRGEAADPMEPRPARAAAMPASLGGTGTERRRRCAQPWRAPFRPCSEFLRHGFVAQPSTSALSSGTSRPVTARHCRRVAAFHGLTPYGICQ